ncbi:MAG TPA: VRR-NUC domain-containing protein [Nitrososphaera sp.]|jgi:hypothetical protein
MEKLRKLAFEKRNVARQTDIGEIHIEALKIHFPCASLQQIKKSGVLDILNDVSYLSKPVVSTEKGSILFGELAVLRSLERDQWKGVWVDAFHSHGRKDVLWTGMPPTGMAPPMPPKVSAKFQAIKEKNGGLSGFFDVLAWKEEGDVLMFIEYKGKGDSPNENESEWINAAVSTGVKPEQLCIVGYELPI